MKTRTGKRLPEFLSSDREHLDRQMTDALHDRHYSIAKEPLVYGSEKKDYAPSLPNSAVHSAFRSKSSLLTVGRDALIALMKSLTRNGGSASCSPSSSVQDISFACGSPGEQGVHFWVPSSAVICAQLAGKRGAGVAAKVRGGDLRACSAWPSE